MTRIKSAAQRAPQTKEQAIALLETFAQVSANVRLTEAARTEQLALINAAADAELVPLAAQLKDIVKQLKPWWAANIEELTAGKRKSIELASCALGDRLNPPKVHFANGKDADGVAALQSNGFGERLVRMTPTLDKPAILRLLQTGTDPGSDADAAEIERLAKIAAEITKLAELGFSVRQTEEFFVEVITPNSPVDELKQTIAADTE